MPERRAEFVELDRRFHELQASPRPEEAAVRSYTSPGSRGGYGWDELLKTRLVVILGEPGSGKTWELEERARELFERGAASFFVRLDQLTAEGLQSLLSAPERARFQEWARGDHIATFFLDSVDESKLRSPQDFRAALARLRLSLDDSVLSRVKLVISSRISEWQPETDRNELLRLFGTTPSAKDVDVASSTVREVPTSASPSLQIVTLEPLAVHQVERLVCARGISPPADFLAAVDASHAWEFARRPLDVADLADLWQQERRIGSLSDLLEFTIGRQLRETIARERVDPLSPERARTGAETLAAATALCRQLAFRIADDAVAPGAITHGLDPAACLPPDWTADQARALLTRPLFDSASYGRIRFHHRRIGEFLTAKWLIRRIREGCPIEEIESLLCDTASGRLLRPALLPVSVWLCADDGPLGANARQWVLEAAPEGHLQYGDPARLSSDYKRETLRRLVERFADRRRVWVESDIESLSRLGDPTISADVASMVRDSSISTDLRAQLLMLVRFSRLEACLEAAVDIIIAPTEPSTLKVYAAAAIRDVPNAAVRQRLLSALPSLQTLPSRVCTILCEGLYPGGLDSRGVADLLRKAGSPADSAYYLKSHLEQALLPEDAAALARDLVALGQTPPHAGAEEPGIAVSREFSWIGEVLPTVLLKSLSQMRLDGEEVEIVARALLFLGAYRRLDFRHSLPAELSRATDRHPQVRRHWFWLRVEQLRSIRGSEPTVFRLALDPYRVLALAVNDIDWLVADIEERPNLPDRDLAMRVALQLSYSSPSPHRVRSRIARAVAREPALRRSVKTFTRDARLARVRYLWRVHVHDKVGQGWWWRQHWWTIKQRLQRQRDHLFLLRNLRRLQAGQLVGPLGILASEARGENDAGHLTSRSWHTLESQRGRRIARATRIGCKCFWKTFLPPLPHESPPNTIDRRVVIGLTGIAASLADQDLNFGALDADSAAQVTRYALNEINGFPPWLFDLARDRAAVVQDVLNQCVRGEWQFPPDRLDVHHVMHDLAWRGNELRALVSETILRLLERGGPSNVAILQNALSILLRGDVAIRTRSISVFLARLREMRPDDPTLAIWVAAAIQIDARATLTILETKLGELAPQARDALVVNVCAALSEAPGGNSEVIPINEPDYATPASLARFIPLVYEHVRVEVDIHRAGQGSFHPVERDAAQDFRDSLLVRLADCDTVQSMATMVELQRSPALAAVTDWIAHLIDMSRARMTDASAWREEDVRSFAIAHEVDPRTHRDLMHTASKRLRDIKREVEVAEISLREELREGDLEGVLRRWLARKLRERARDRYTVPQEVEIDRGERPDCRIERPGIAAVPIEVKWAERWSVAQLLERLENQLIGQYLRAHDARNGIYFVATIEPGHQWRDPASGALITFEAVIAMLRARAAELVSQREEVDLIEVVSVDFRDPR